MEASEEQPQQLSDYAQRPPIDCEFHQIDKGGEAELGLQSSQVSTSSDPNPSAPAVDDDTLRRIVAQDLQNLCIVQAADEEARNLARKSASSEDKEWKLDNDEEIYRLALQEVIDEVIRREELNDAVREDIASLAASNEELQYLALRRFIDEAVRNHGWNKSDASEGDKDHVEDGKNESRDGLHTSALEDKEVSWKCSDLKEEVVEENQSARENVKDAADDEDDTHHEDKDSEHENYSENGKEEGDSENELVGGTSGAMMKNGKFWRYQYPLRLDAEDCAYYMRTGTCKFGSNCKFNHPRRKKNQPSKGSVNQKVDNQELAGETDCQPSKEKVKQKEDNQEKAGQTECKYYLTTAGCKYGKACRYYHSRENTFVPPILEFNFIGLPIRLGEKECPYYMRTGSCKYGSNCRFNHPDPTAVAGTGHSTGYGNGVSVSLQRASSPTMSSWSSPRASSDIAPYLPTMFPSSQGLPSPNPEWNGYQASVYPKSERSLPTPPAFAMNNPATDTNFFSHHQHSLLEEFPERPGQPECSYFLKTGNCKYRSACKFHHPKIRTPKTSTCTLSDRGLPLRPDQSICTHYSRYGICKFGPACKFDHPENHENSVSSGDSGKDRPPCYGKSATASGNGRESLIQQPV